MGLIEAMNENHLTANGLRAKSYMSRICDLLTKQSGRLFYVNMNYENNTYEGHLIDTGKYIEHLDGSYEISTDENAEEIGMIFFGGFHDTTKSTTAESDAWESLLMDCIGQSDDKDIRNTHNLTNALTTFGPIIDFNFDTIEKLDAFLKSYGL